MEEIFDPKKFSSFKELPEDKKDAFKELEGGFVEKTAVENKDVAHRMALLENEAFGELSKSVEEGGVSIEEIQRKLGDKENRPSYDQKNILEELLLQTMDLERLKGRSIDESMRDFLKQTYITLKYSDLLRHKLTKGVEEGDTEVIGEMMKDEKIYIGTSDLLKKLKNDNQRLEAFNICKERSSAACDIIRRIENNDLALEMYREAIEILKVTKESDYHIRSLGKDLAGKLFKSGELEKISDLVKSGIFRVSYLEKFIHSIGDKPQFIVDLIKDIRKEDEIYYPIKFIADSSILKPLMEGNVFENLDERAKKEAVEYVDTTIKALEQKAKIVSLSDLKMDVKNDWGKFDPKNKFVVGIEWNSGKYFITWGNMDEYEYHRNLFDEIPRSTAKSGGYLGLSENDGKLMVRMERCSGDFGYYSKEVLEHYREDIEGALSKVLEGREFELEIKISTD